MVGSYCQFWHHPRLYVNILKKTKERRNDVEVGWPALSNPRTCTSVTCSAHGKAVARVCDRSLTGIAGSKPSRAMDVRLLSVVCSAGRGLCGGPITRPEDTCRMCCVSVFEKPRV